MLKKYLLISLIFFLFPITLQATLAPQVYFTDLNISKTTYNPGEVITGSASVWNYESAAMSDLVFNFMILGDMVNNVPTRVIDEKRDSNIFSLAGGQKITKSFSYTLPENLPSGELVFRVQLSNSRGEKISWKDAGIFIEGGGKFLDVGNAWIVKNGEKLPIGGGVEYDPSEVPAVIFDVENNSGSEINAYYKLNTYIRNVGEIIKQTDGPKVTFASGQKQTVEANLHQLAAPNTYLSEIRFYETGTNNPVSNSIYFRWIIGGENDASILYTNPNKLSYEQGENAEIEVRFTGPAINDYETENPGEAVVEVELLDEDGNSVCRTSKTTPLKTSKELIDCPVAEKVENPTIKVAVKKGDELLDEYSLFTGTKSKETSIGLWAKRLMVIFGAVAVLITIILYFILSRNSMSKNGILYKIIIFFLASGGILIACGASAAVQTVSGPYDTTVRWVSPIPYLPGGEYNPGEDLDFTGSVEITTCGNYLYYNRFDFFIAPDRDMPTKIINACSDCRGAAPPEVDCQARGCDKVEVLDEDDPDLYYLGSYFSTDDLMEGAYVPYWLEYNFTKQIPDISALGYSGNIRFYMQYYGLQTGWGAQQKSHWKIAYQPGLITESDTTSCYNWAWSENIGWVSFDSITGGSASAYEVGIDGSNCNTDGCALNGYAWSENIGWVSFERTDTGAPPAAPLQADVTAIARYNPNDRTISGWMRALAYDGDWDGWMRLEDVNVDLAGDWHGWAWSDFVVGWLSFNHLDSGAESDICYKVGIGTLTLDHPPMVQYASVSKGNYCISPAHYFTWTYYSDHSNENEYQFQVDTESDFNSPIIDVHQTGLSVSSPAQNNESALVTESLGDNLDFNTTYYWQARVRDADGDWSEWTQGPSFSTDKHKYPLINDISWSPESVEEEEGVDFFADAECYDIDNNPIACALLDWAFENGTPSSSNDPNPSGIQFSVGEDLNIILEVIDGDDYLCPRVEQVDVAEPIPIWIEE